jgi:hypothetical protein
MRKQKSPTPDALGLSKMGTARRAGELAKASVWPFVVGTVAFYVLAAVVWWLWEGADKLAWKKVTGGAFYPSIIALAALLILLGIVSAVRAHLQVHAAHRTRAEEAEEREAALITARDQAEIGPKHQKRSEELFAGFRQAVESGQQCSYGRDHDREAIALHYPPVLAGLGRWDELVEKERAAPAALRQFSLDDAQREGVQEPWDAALADYIQGEVAQLARDGLLDRGVRLPVGAQHETPPEGAELLTIVAGQKTLMVLTPQDDIQKQAVEAENLVLRLFDSAKASEEARAIGTTQAARIDSASGTSDLIDCYALISRVTINLDCPLCKLEQR